MPTVLENIGVLFSELGDSVADIYRSENTFIIGLISFLFIVLAVTVLIIGYLICWECCYGELERLKEDKFNSENNLKYMKKLNSNATRTKQAKKASSKKKTD